METKIFNIGDRVALLWHTVSFVTGTVTNISNRDSRTEYASFKADDDGGFWSQYTRDLILIKDL
jgi:hypothetical protein